MRETLKENKLAKVREQYEKLEARHRSVSKIHGDILDVCRKEVEFAENAHDDELLREAKATQKQMVELVN